jgi:hypothetical protein
MHQIIDKLYTEYHGERKTGKVKTLRMGEITVAEYEAVLPFGICKYEEPSRIYNLLFCIDS